MTRANPQNNDFLSVIMGPDGQMDVERMASALGQDIDRVESCLTMNIHFHASTSYASIYRYSELSGSRLHRSFTSWMEKRHDHHSPYCITELSDDEPWSKSHLPVHILASLPGEPIMGPRKTDEENSPHYMIAKILAPENVAPEGLQEKTEDMFVRIMNRLVSLMTDRKRAFIWYESTSIPALGYVTAKQLVQQGQGQLILDHLDATALGAFA